MLDFNIVIIKCNINNMYWVFGNGCVKIFDYFFIVFGVIGFGY